MLLEMLLDNATIGIISFRHVTRSANAVVDVFVKAGWIILMVMFNLCIWR